MITSDQLKDVMDRAEALHRYLNIDQKKVEFEEDSSVPKLLTFGKTRSMHRSR